jgi:hypothetical protein
MEWSSGCSHEVQRYHECWGVRRLTVRHWASGVGDEGLAGADRRQGGEGGHRGGARRNMVLAVVLDPRRPILRLVR